MKIAYILNSTGQFTGSSKSFIVLLEGLREKSINAIVVLPDKNGIYNYFVEKGIQVFVTTYRPNSYPPHETINDYFLFFPRLIGRILANAIAFRKLAIFLSDKDVDLIHTNVGVINIGYKVSRRLHIPHIYHIREYADIDFNIKYFPNKASFRKQLNSEKSYSIFITKALQTYYHQDNRPTSWVIYNGIQGHAQTLPHKSDGDYFLIIGRIEPAKGHDQLLEAYFAYLALSTTPLPIYIVGDVNSSTFIERIRQYIHSHGMESHISFLGHRNDTAELMRNARAVIVPSQFEGFGRVMAEAMFNGCLVIGRNTAGTKEQFDNGLQLCGEEIGMRYNSTEELAECLKQAESMSSYCYKHITNKAFDVVNKLYTTDTYVSAVLSCYQHIITS